MASVRDSREAAPWWSGEPDSDAPCPARDRGGRMHGGPARVLVREHVVLLVRGRARRVRVERLLQLQRPRVPWRPALRPLRRGALRYLRGGRNRGPGGRAAEGNGLRGAAQRSAVF